MALAVVATLAPRQHSRDVKQIIAGLVRENPKANAERLAALLAEELRDDDELLLSVAGDLVRKSLTPAKPKPTLKAAETARRQRVACQVAANSEAQAVAGKVRQTVLLNLIMPNGVAMRYCTGTQMGGFSDAYAKIAERVGDAMVGEILVEAEIKALLQVAPA
jgi:hypothetical protein